MDKKIENQENSKKLTATEKAKQKSLRWLGPAKFSDRPGYKRRLVNVNGRNYERALDLGYQVVYKDGINPNESSDTDDLSSAVVITGNRSNTGNGMKQVLMEIPIDVYNERRQEKEAITNDREKAIKPESKSNSDWGMKITRDK